MQRPLLRILARLLLAIFDRIFRPSLRLTIRPRNSAMPDPTPTAPAAPFDLTSTPAVAAANYNDGLGGTTPPSRPAWAFDSGAITIATLAPSDDGLTCNLDADGTHMDPGTTTVGTLTCTIGSLVAEADVQVSKTAGPTPTLSITITPR